MIDTLQEVSKISSKTFLAKYTLFYLLVEI